MNNSFLQIEVITIESADEINYGSINTLKYAEQSIVKFFQDKSKIPLSSLSQFTIKHFIGVMSTEKITLKKIFEESGVTKNMMHRIINCNDDSYGKTLLKLGLPQKFVILFTQGENRYQYLVDSGFGLQLLLQFGKKQLEKESNHRPISKEDILYRTISLTQKEMKGNWVIRNIFNTAKTNQTSQLKLDCGLITSLYELSTWPQAFCKNHKAEAKLAYKKLKTDLSIMGHYWPYTTNEIRNNAIGRKLLDLFNNSISNMVIFFEGIQPDTEVRPQHAWEQINECIITIKKALLNFKDENEVSKPKVIADLPDIKLNELIKHGNMSSYPSVLSTYHKKTHVEMCIHLFPEYGWKDFQFIGGVKDHHWIDKRTHKLKLDNIREAIDFLLTKVFRLPPSANNETKQLYLISLTQKDFSKYNLSTLAALQNTHVSYGLHEVIKCAYPEFDLKFKDQNLTRNALKLMNNLMSKNKINKMLSLEDCTEINSAIGQSGKRLLCDDLHLDLFLDNEFQKIVFEIQGPQHNDSEHYFHTNKNASKDSFSKQVLNDALKYTHHVKMNQPIYYVKSQQLYDGSYIQALKMQGLDLSNDTLTLKDPLEFAHDLEDGGFVGKGFFSHVFKIWGHMKQ